MPTRADAERDFENVRAVAQANSTVWDVAQLAVDLAQQFDALPWWAGWRRWSTRRQMHDAVARATEHGLGQEVGRLFGARLTWR